MSRLVVFSFIGAQLLASRANAADYFVAPSGSDKGNGTLSAPFKTVQHAVNQLAPGDSLTLRGGTYFERVTLTQGGTAQKPIVIQGYPGEVAVLDSGYTEFRNINNNDWELVDASLGEYRSKRSCAAKASRAYVLGLKGYVNERLMLVPYDSAASFRSSTEKYNPVGFYVGPGTFSDPQDGRCHIRLKKTAALSEYEARYGKLFDGLLPDPRKHQILLSQESVTLDIKAAYITLRGFTVNQATRAIRFNVGARNLGLEEMIVWSGNSAIAAVAPGVTDVVVSRSRIYGDFPAWVFWSDMKDSPTPANLARGTSIDMAKGAKNWEIKESHIRGSGQDLIGVNDDESGLSVHHSRIENCGDDAFEIEATTDIGRIEIYENFVSNCLVGVAPGQDSVAMTGPLLVYRNVFAMLRDAPVNREPGINTWNGGSRFGYEYMLKHGASSYYSTANTHYYHNTFVMLNAYKGINSTPKNPKNTTVANNVMVVVNDQVHGPYRQDSEQLIDGNLYWKPNTNNSEPLVDGHDTVAELFKALGIEAKGLGSAAKQGTDPKFAVSPLDFADQSGASWTLTPGGERSRPSKFLLSAKSPACKAGVVLKGRKSLDGQSLPDSRNFAVGLGAYPCGTKAATLDVWPFDPDGPGAAGGSGAGGNGAGGTSGGSGGGAAVAGSGSGGYGNHGGSGAAGSSLTGQEEGGGCGCRVARYGEGRLALFGGLALLIAVARVRRDPGSSLTGGSSS